MGQVIGPDGAAQLYAESGYRPSQERSDGIADVIERELGPFVPAEVGPEIRRVLGADELTPIGLFNRGLIGLADQIIGAIDLAGYTIDVGAIVMTESARQAGWMDQTDAARLRRDLRLATLMLAAESGRGPGRVLSDTKAAQLRILTAARAAQQAAKPSAMLRVIRGAGASYERTFLLSCDVWADNTQFGAAPGANTWLAKVRAGKAWELMQTSRYDFRQVYVIKNEGKGYWVLDALGSELDGNRAIVSLKFTQIADIQVGSAIQMLREAYRKYRPGTIIGSTPSVPRAFRNKPLTGQLWLEVPVQTKDIPSAVINYANRLDIRIRDVKGRIYN